MAIQIETNQIQNLAISTGKLAADAVTGAKIADDAVGSEHLAAGAVDNTALATGSVSTGKLAADAVDGTKIADDAIGSEHIADSAVLAAALASNAVTSAKINDGAVTYAKLAAADIQTSLSSATDKLVRADAIQAAIDNAIDGRQWKTACDLATTGNITLSGEQTIDGTLTSGSRVLVWQQTTASQNGVYTSASGAWSRTSDFDGAGDKIAGSAMLIKGGSTYDNIQFVCTNDTDPSVGVDAINFAEMQAGVADGSITTAKLAADAVTGAKIADDAVDSEHIAAGAIDSEHFSAGAVDATALGSNAVTEAKINAAAVTSTKIADAAVSTAKIADAAVSTVKLADDSVTAAKIGFSSNWDVLSPNGSLTDFDLSATVDSTFASLIVVRNGAIQKQVASSPADDSEYTVALTGGAGGVTRITFGSAPANGSDLRVWFLG